jgi:hypothetical protein
MTDMADRTADAQARLSRPQVEDVFAATEEVRANRFPSVPAELLSAVLAAEQDNLDNRLDGQRAVARAVDSWLAGSRDRSRD